MTTQEISTVKELLQNSKKIAIIPHRNPDGDAMGSTLALKHFLDKKGHQCTVVAPNMYPKFLHWLPGNDDVITYETQKNSSQEVLQEADLIFTLDFNHRSRMGNEMEAFIVSLDKTYIMIDHHEQPDTYATVTYSKPEMSSTCEMVYHFINYLEETHLIDKAIASCIYTGIMTDTGSFRFASTTATTHQVVAELMEKGAENHTIHQNVLDTNSYSKMQLLGKALSNLKVLPELRTAYITLSQKELNDHNFKKGDTEGFVNYGLSLEGIIFAVIFIENKDEGIIKISFRSKGTFSVNDFARAHYNGGGHHNAAGGKSDLSLKQTTQEFVNLLPQYKDTLNA